MSSDTRVIDAARKLVERLDENDPLSLVIFDDDVDIECGLREGFKQLAAREVEDRTAALLQAEAEALDDAPLRAEAELAGKLAALMTP